MNDFLFPNIFKRIDLRATYLFTNFSEFLKVFFQSSGSKKQIGSIKEKRQVGRDSIDFQLYGEEETSQELHTYCGDACEWWSKHRQALSFQAGVNFLTLSVPGVCDFSHTPTENLCHFSMSWDFFSTLHDF